MMPVIAYNLLQSIDLLAAAAEHLADKCLDARAFFESHQIAPPGVTATVADPRAADSLERSLAMCTALAPEIGYDAAAAIAKKAYKTGKNVREVALALAGKSAAEAATVLGLDQPLAQDIPPARTIERLLEPHGQTVRGTGVGRAAGG